MIASLTLTNSSAWTAMAVLERYGCSPDMVKINYLVSLSEPPCGLTIRNGLAVICPGVKVEGRRGWYQTGVVRVRRALKCKLWDNTAEQGVGEICRNG